MPKIILEKERCIGCGSCAVICPKYFELAEDGKSHIKGSNKHDPEGTLEELEVEKVECAEFASEACPVQCIHIEK